MTDVLLLADIPSTGYLVGTAAERVSGTARANEETGRFIAYLAHRLQTSDAVIAMYPTWHAGSARRLLKLARTLLDTDKIAEVSLNLPPLALSLVADQVAYLAPYLQPGHLASVAHSLAASMSAGAWTRSVTKLEHIDTRMSDHLASYLPHESFVITAAPRTAIHRMGGRKVPDLGFRPAEPIHLLITQGDITWFQDSMQKLLRPGAVKVVPAQPLGVTFWGNKRYIEYVAFSGHPSALSQIANATRCWLCRWCGQQTALRVCPFCNMSQVTPQGVPTATPTPPAPPSVTPRAALPAPASSDAASSHASAVSPVGSVGSPQSQAAAATGTAAPAAPEPVAASGPAAMPGPAATSWPAAHGAATPGHGAPGGPDSTPHAVPTPTSAPVPPQPPAVSREPAMPPAAAHPSPPYAPVASAGPAALGGTPATPDPRLAPEVQLSRPGTPPGVSPRAVQPTDQRVAGPAPEAGGGGPYHPQHTQAPPGLRLVQSGQGQPEPPRQPQPPAAEPAQHARHQPPYPSQSPAQHTQTPQGPQAPQPPHQPYTQSASQMPQMPHPQMPHNPQSPQTPRQAAQQLRADPNWNGRNAVGAGGHAAPDATQAYAQVPPGQISSQYPSAVDTVRGATPAFGPDQPPSQSARSDHEWTQRNPGQFSTGGSQPNGHHRVSP